MSNTNCINLFREQFPDLDYHKLEHIIIGDGNMFFKSNDGYKLYKYIKNNGEPFIFKFGWSKWVDCGPLNNFIINVYSNINPDKLTILKI